MGTRMLRGMLNMLSKHIRLTRTKYLLTRSSYQKSLLYVKKNYKVIIQKYGLAKFQYICILSGCLTLKLYQIMASDLNSRHIFFVYRNLSLSRF